MKARIILLLILVSVLWTAMITRAAFLQIIPNKRLETLQKRQFETVVTLNSRRGDVLDRNGQELAISTTSHSLFVDPKILAESGQVAKFLAKEIKLPYKTILEKLRKKKSRFVWIARHLDHGTRERIAARKIRGLGFVEESKRTYPNDRLLANVLGFVGGEGGGLEGVEAQYNAQLEADKKDVSIQRDARGRPLIVGGQLFSEVPAGNDLQLTIDRDLQFVLEQELRAAVERHEAEAATGVILDAQTSEILAMANAPTYDPNKAADFAPDRRRNRTVTDAFEPGSTMKTFVVAAALAKKLIEPNTKFYCEDGKFKIGGRTIRDSDHKFKSLTVTEIVQYSSNIGTAKIAMKLGAQQLHDTLADFGFGSRSGVDLPGEARGILNALPWREHLFANISFGHGVSATPLQVANAYAAVANGGWLRRPYIVKRIHDYNTGDDTDIGPKTLRRVLPEDVSAKMRLILSAVTAEEGTGFNARVVGYPVAGKTGTAQKVNPNGRGYLPGAYVSSFAGFLPANEPKFVIFVSVDNPRKGYYGSQVAAPVFARVASFAVRQAGLSPILISESDLVKRTTAATAPASQAIEAPLAAATSVPELQGLTLREVIRRMQGSGMELQVKGHGIVRDFYPPVGTQISKGAALKVVLEPGSIQ